jgi:hypothetical protein
LTLPLFPSAAARSEAEETIPKRLLGAFNCNDAAVLDVAAAAVPAIAKFSEIPPRNAAAAAAFIAEFELNTEKTRALHESNPGAGDGNSRLIIKITYLAHLTVTRPGTGSDLEYRTDLCNGVDFEIHSDI